jgi:hypothetical protein
MKKVWSKPELRRLVAGGAESRVKTGVVDSTPNGNGGNNFS